MTVTLQDLKEDARSVEVDVKGEKLTITYRPSSYTPVTEREFRDALQSSLPANAMTGLLAGIMEEWDLLDENGHALPIDRESMDCLPTWFIGVVANTIMEDMNASREDRKNSGAGSQRRGSLANSRNGSRSTS